MPCEIMEANFISRKGRNNYLVRHFLSAPDKNGNRTVNKYIAGMRNYDEILKAYKAGEGCKISGYFYVHLISQKFNVLFRNPQIIQQLNKDIEGGIVLDLTHKINDLRIGENIDIGESTIEDYNLKGVNTLKNHFVEEDRSDGYKYVFYHTYQITVNALELKLFRQFQMRLIEPLLILNFSSMFLLNILIRFQQEEKLCLSKLTFINFLFLVLIFLQLQCTVFSKSQTRLALF